MILLAIFFSLMQKHRTNTKHQLAKLLPDIGVNTSFVIYRADIGQSDDANEEEDTETTKAIEQKPRGVESLMQLCVNYINKNGKTLFSDALQRMKPLKKYKRRSMNREYIKRMTKKKKRRLMIVNGSKDFGEHRVKNVTIKKKLNRKATKPTTVKREIKKELSDDEFEDNWSGRPRRKVAVPFYYPDHAETPSPETVMQPDNVKVKAKPKPKSRLSDTQIVGTKSSIKPMVKKLSTSISMSSKGKIKAIHKSNVVVKAKKSTATLDKSPEFLVKKARAKNRINYSEALVDEALMYEEMLLDKRERQQQMALEKCRKVPGQKSKPVETFVPKSARPSIAKSKASVKSTPVVRNEVTLLPVVKNGKRDVDAKNSKVDLSLDRIKKTLVANPAKIINFNSSVSIQLKPSSSNMKKAATSHTKSSTGLAIKNIHSLFDNHGSNRNTNCGYCRESFSSRKLLAMHQLIHMRVTAYKVGQALSLQPNLRKVGFFVYSHVLLH